MDRKALKKQAKGLIKTAEPRPVSVTIFYVVILIAFAFLSYKLVGEPVNDFFSKQFNDTFSFNFTNDSDYAAHFEQYIDDIDPEQFFYAWQDSMPSPLASLLNMLLTVMGWVISAGFIIFTLRTIAGSGASVWNLFDGFGMFFRIIWLYILQGIFVLLWSLLFIIPGIIAFYRYRLAIYLLLEHPEMSANECLNESSRLMRGHKWELFVLDLSFIGWAFLVGILNSAGSRLGIEFFKIIGLGYLVYLYWMPFRGLSYSLFYKQLTEKPEADYEPEWTPEF